MPVNKVSIVLDRPRRVYHQGEYISGNLVVENKQELKHEGIHVALEGFVDIHFNLKSLSFIDTFYGTKKSLRLVDSSCELIRAGKLEPGRSEWSFRLLLDGLADRTILYESYYGVFISIQYCIRACVKRPLLSRDLVEITEFNVEYDPHPIGAPPLLKQPVPFEITSNSLTADRYDVVPDFKIWGHFDGRTFALGEPVTGELVVDYCEAVIQSVELQLVRVETCGQHPCDRDYSRDATEVQNIQIADGDVLRKTPLYMHMVIPRLFTCPSLITSSFKIEFEINLVVIFEDNHLITENFPVKFVRSTMQAINLLHQQHEPRDFRRV